MRLHLALLVACAVTLPCTASAQESPPAAPPACLDSIPAAALASTVVYLVDDVPDTTSAEGRAFMIEADLFTQALAERVRMLIDSVPGHVGPVEPTLSWRDLEEGVEARVDSAGRVTWEVLPFRLSLAARPGAGAALLVRALTAMRDAGERFTLTDPALAGRTFQLRFRHQARREDGQLYAMTLRVGFPVFTARVPSRTNPGFPSNFLRGPVPGAPARTAISFVIQSDGWPDPQSFEIPAEYRVDEREDGRLVQRYRDTYRGMHWTPQRIAGCAVPSALTIMGITSPFRVRQ